MGTDAATESAARRPSYVNSNATPLAVQRAFADRYAGVLDALRKANESPATSSDGWRAESEERFVVLERFVASAAHVQFADGQPRAAVTVLLDGLLAAQRLRTGVPKGSVEGAGAVIDGVERHLELIPLVDCDRIRVATDAALPVFGRDPVANRLRILRLHMRILAYRWRQLKLPGSLSSAAPAAEALNPLTGRPFGYLQVGEGYRLSDERS